jgi:hypothetical protein
MIILALCPRAILSKTKIGYVGLKEKKDLVNIYKIILLS